MFIDTKKERNFFKISTSEQHTATDLVNLLFFLRPVSSDHTDFVREFYQAKMDTRYLFYTLFIHYKSRYMYKRRIEKGKIDEGKPVASKEKRRERILQ